MLDGHIASSVPGEHPSSVFHVAGSFLGPAERWQQSAVALQHPVLQLGCETMFHTHIIRRLLVGDKAGGQNSLERTLLQSIAQLNLLRNTKIEHDRFVTYSKV
jgi:hypothetical protein